MLPFDRFPDVDTILGPEMRSTGEVMGIDRSFGLAFAKSQAAARQPPAALGHGVPLARRPRQAVGDGRRRAASPSSASGSWPPRAPPPRSRPRGSPSRRSSGKLGDGDGADGIDAVDLISSGKVDLVVNTPRGRGPRADGAHIRRTATARGIPCLTTVAAALAASAGIAEWARQEPDGALAPGVPRRRPAPARGLMRARLAPNRRQHAVVDAVC